jgi:hypothetical protein
MMMHRIRATATVVALGIAIAGSTVALASAAQAVPAKPTVGSGSFTTWVGAQRAAGFKLLKPGRTDGLKRFGRIDVSSCGGRARQVGAGYGNPAKAFLGIEQDNAAHGEPCGNIGVAKDLGRYRVNGVWAYLVGECGVPHELPKSCRSRDIFLFLSWTKHNVFYQASSNDQWRATIVAFARHLVRVG